jgi:Fur family ferric uptake transcriptional regulator
MTDAAARDDRLARAGLRATRARRVVLAQLQAAGAMFDAIALHRQVGLHDARISLPTVYRTLREFERSGIVRATAVPHGRMQWQLASAAPRAQAVTVTAIERLARQAARLGYRLVPEPA